MLTYAAPSSGSPAAAWALLARPDRWSRWAPHIRGGVGLGSPEVRAGRRGVVLLGGALPVPVRITAVIPGRRWDWRVGPVDMSHQVIARPGGCEVRIDLSAPGPLEIGLRISYGPVVALLVSNLARVAAGQPA